MICRSGSAWQTRRHPSHSEWSVREEYNKHAAKKVRIEGIDMQNFAGTLLRLNEISEGRFYEEIIQPVNSIIRHVADEYDKRGDVMFSFSIRFNEEQRAVITAGMSRLRHWAVNNLSDPAIRDRFVSYTGMVEQYLEYSGLNRNRFMAENIIRLSELNPDAKIMFIAHNSHVGKGNSVTGKRETGDWLRERFGKDYYVIGACFSRGAYMGGYNGRYTVAPAFPGMPGSYEYMFESIGKPRFFLNWRKVKRSDDNAWLFHPMLLRSTGADWSQNEYHPVPLTERFDAVVFMEVSLPITTFYK